MLYIAKLLVFLWVQIVHHLLQTCFLYWHNVWVLSADRHDSLMCRQLGSGWEAEKPVVSSGYNLFDTPKMFSPILNDFNYLEYCTRHSTGKIRVNHVVSKHVPKCYFVFIFTFLQSQRDITLQWPNRPKRKLRLAHLLLLINIYAKYQVIQVKTVVKVQYTRFLQTDRELSFLKSTPDRILAKSKGHNSAMT